MRALMRPNFMEIDVSLDIPNTTVDKAGRAQRARHIGRLTSDPEYARRWRITNALAKHKALGERPKVTLPRVMWLERPEI